MDAGQLQACIGGSPSAVPPEARAVSVSKEHVAERGQARTRSGPDWRRARRERFGLGAEDAQRGVTGSCLCGHAVTRGVACMCAEAEELTALEPQLVQTRAARQAGPDRQLVGVGVDGLIVRQQGPAEVGAPPQQLEHHMRTPTPACTGRSAKTPVYGRTVYLAMRSHAHCDN